MSSIVVMYFVANLGVPMEYFFLLSLFRSPVPEVIGKFLNRKKKISI